MSTDVIPVPLRFPPMKLKKSQNARVRTSRLRVVEASRLASRLFVPNEPQASGQIFPRARKLLQKTTLPVCLFSSSHFRALSRSFALFRDNFQGGRGLCLSKPPDRLFNQSSLSSSFPSFQSLFS